MRPTPGTVIGGGNGTVPRGHAAVTRGIHTVIGMLGTVALREMDFLVLGPLEVHNGSEPIRLTGARQRGLLALLLLHRNEVLGSERLIDELWGESPPPTAAKALQNAVLQVRRALGEHAGALRTEGGGYVLRVEPGELDADRFEQLHAEGRAASDAGDHAAAAKRLRDALALWRGPPFADLSYERFAQPEIARLEDERVAALEDRIEADLALGRHAALVPELEAAVARHPLRERLRAQLMTALYRAGRQAEALEVFHDARRALLDELGIEPGPELRERHEAILRQDPALLPRGRTHAPAAARSRLPLLAGAAAVLLLAAVAAATLLMTGDEEPAAAQLGTVPGNSLVAIDPRTASIIATYPVGSTPTSVTAGAAGAWTLNADDSTLSRVAARTSAPRTVAVPDTPLDVAAGANGVWTLTGTRARFGDQIIPRRVLLLDPATSAIQREVTLPEGDHADWFSLNRLALGGTTLWTLGAGDRLTRIDTLGRSAPAQVPGVTASTVAASGDGAWALTQRPRGYRLVHVSHAGRVTARVPLVATDLDGMAAGAGALWITAPQDGLLWRVTPEATRSIDVGAGARGVAVAGDEVWVANASRGTVTRVDPRTNRVDAVMRLGNAPRALAWDGKRLWVSVAAGGGGAPARDAARAASGAVTAPELQRGDRGRRHAAAADRVGHAAAPARDLVHPGRDRVRAAQPRLPSRQLPDRLPVVRRLDREAGRLRAREVQGECGPLRGDATRHRHRRAVQLGLRRRAARDREPRRPTRDDLADEHGTDAHQAAARRDAR